MTDEQTNTPTEGEIKEVAQSVPRPDEYPAGQADALAERIETGRDPNIVEEAVVGALAASEQASEGPAAQGWDAAVTGIQKGIEALGTLPETPQEAHAHIELANDFTFMGRHFPFPVYTGIFLALGALTLIEVGISGFPPGALRIFLLMVIALMKALLVVAFYMHLRSDSRVFLVALLLPTLVALLSMMFALSVPSFGY